MSPPQPSDGWTFAVELAARWLREPGRVDWLLERFATGLPGTERARCQDLLSAAIRNHSRLEAAFAPLLRRTPRPRLRAILHIAGAEIIENTDAAPALVVDHAVGMTRAICSKAESGMVNAVLRKAALALRVPPPDPASASAAELALFFSHPEWLVHRWVANFGRGATIDLLEWDQRPADVHLRLAPGAEAPEWLQPTPWAGFFRLKSGHWDDALALLSSGRAYVQDPATRLAPELLAPTPGSTVLDLCAAPGGKALQLAEKVGPGGCVVCVDQPGPRIPRLEENVARYRAANPDGARMEIIASDVLALDAAALGTRSLPAQFEAVMLDAPCSNTGVLRHRVDARWRLRPGDPMEQAATQLKLLRAAAAFVAPGGKLVYSTCSLEPEENAGVVTAFLTEVGAGFTLERSIESRPWESGHDGAGAFLLRRV
ncbi:MAG TPA: RsmB/NOP family class I SAM-dependent RNA methyltransferase [Opitutaceae bacterium]|nr:RsmB/NOP family class I SAM-dependent RNA methyltransferase [Opitutaceae bacterium]